MRVVTGVEYVSDYIEDGVTGFIVVHGDAAALRSRIKPIMEDAGLRRKVGKAARKRAWRDCRPEGYRSNILAVMKGLTAPEGLGLKSVPWAGQGRSMEVNPARALYGRNLKHRPLTPPATK